MRKQSGVFLLEALVAILIFAFGVLGMLAMSGAAISGQTDAQVRADAAGFANQLAGQIALNVPRVSQAGVAAALAPFALNAGATQPASACGFPIVANTSNAANPAAALIIANWINAVTGATGTNGLPGATPNTLSVFVSTSGPQNAVTITECWQSPTDPAQHNYTMTFYVDY